MDANGHQSPRASQRSQLRLEALPVCKVEASRGLQVHSPHSAHTSTRQGTGSATDVAIGIIITVRSATSGIAHEPTGSVGTGRAMCAATTTMPLGHSAESVLARLQSLRGQLLESKGLGVWEQRCVLHCVGCSWSMAHAIGAAIATIRVASASVLQAWSCWHAGRAGGRDGGREGGRERSGGRGEDMR